MSTTGLHERERDDESMNEVFSRESTKGELEKAREFMEKNAVLMSGEDLDELDRLRKHIDEG